LLKPSKYRHMGGGGVAKPGQITFIVAKKLNLQFILLYLRYMCGEGVGWKRQTTVICGEGV